MADRRDDAKMAPSGIAEAVDVSATNWTPAAGQSTAGVYVGGAGIIKVDFESLGTAIQLTVPAGALLPIQVTKIYNADTTATLIVALF